MPTYVYRAKQGPDRTVDGEISADSRAAVLVRLDAMGCSPIWVREKEAETAGSFRAMVARGVGVRDVTVFTGQLASLTRSAVPILRALDTIARQTENPRMARVVRDIEATIRDGNMLSDALARHPRLFPGLYRSMVRAGESAGVLDVVLTRLTEARERDEDLRRRVQAALAYPLLILAVGFATVFALFAFFLPRVVVLFTDYRRLPLPTRLLIGVSDFFSAYWPAMLIGILLAAAVLNRLAALERGRLFFDRMKLRLPLLRKFLCEADLTRFARTLSLLVEAGISIDKALELSADTMRNEVLRDEILEARERTIRQGMPLSDGLRRAPHVPPLLTNLAAIGEEGGRLPEALAEVAAFYGKEMEQRGRLVTGLLEPVLILAVGAVVGFIVAAMLLPIFELGTGMR